MRSVSVSFFNKHRGLLSVLVFIVPAHSKLRELENRRLSDRYRIATDTGCIISNRISFCRIKQNPILRASLQVRQLLTGRITQDDQREFAPRHLPCANTIGSSMIWEGVEEAGGGKRLQPYTSIPVTLRRRSTGSWPPATDDAEVIKTVSLSVILTFL